MGRELTWTNFSFEGLAKWCDVMRNVDLAELDNTQKIGFLLKPGKNIYLGGCIILAEIDLGEFYYIKILILTFILLLYQFYRPKTAPHNNSDFNRDNLWKDKIIHNDTDGSTKKAII